jgi:hypothetical protein
MSNHGSPPNSAGQTLNGCYRTSRLLVKPRRASREIVNHFKIGMQWSSMPRRLP